MAGADQLPYVVCRIGWRLRGVVGGERRLVGDDARDGQAGRGGAQRDRGAGSVAERERRPGPGRRRDGRQVFVLPLRRERFGVAAVTPAAAVIGDDRELLR